MRKKISTDPCAANEPRATHGSPAFAGSLVAMDGLFCRASTNRLVEFFIVLVALVPFTGIPAWGAADGKQEEAPIREIFVPFEDLDVLLEGDAQRVFLTREQYEDLLEKAKETPETPAPRAAMLSTADYEGTVSEGRA